MIGSRRDRLAIVQFIHPGGEHDDVNADGWCEWTGAESTASHRSTFAHRRKFLIAEARHSSASSEHRGIVGLWGEWEAPSRAVMVRRHRLGNLPRFHHAAAFRAPRSYEGLADTDPFVFGGTFLYSGCQQHTCHARAEGAVETFLRRLKRGSLILFGSNVGERFVMDTAFVVADHVDYERGDHLGLVGRVPNEYHHVTLGPQARGNASVDSFRLYFGATRDDPIDGAFSFAPCRPSNGRATDFERPTIALDGIINHRLKQGKKMTEANEAMIAEAWRAVRDQVLSRGLNLAHEVRLAQASVDAEAAS